MSIERMEVFRLLSRGLRFLGSCYGRYAATLVCESRQGKSGALVDYTRNERLIDFNL